MADSPVTEQYGGQQQSVSPNIQAGGQLAFTGLDVVALTIVALVCVGGGLLLRRHRGQAG